MYAIIEVGGLQYKVAKDQKLRVPKIDKEVGKSVELKNVLLFVDKDKVEVGKPIVKNISVKATILSHGKDKKVLVFKKKRRKGYKVLKGHRQQFTEIKIDKIGTVKEAAPKPASAKTAAKPKAAPKAKTEAKPKTAPKKKPAANTTKTEKKETKK